MKTIQTIVDFLEQLAPPHLAEEWDNVGLLAGDRQREVHKIMTCLTITPESMAEAIEEKANLIVTHHPLPFMALKQLTTDTTPGRLLWDLIGHQIAVYSPHTAFDSAQEGVNQHLASGIGLRGVSPLRVFEKMEKTGTGTSPCSEPVPVFLGAGRWGWLEEPLSLEQLGERLKKFLHLERLQIVGELEQPVRTVAVACGAADELLDAAKDIGCDCMVMGEARFHTCLEAKAAQIGLLLTGHYASERFAVECLAQVLAEKFPQLQIWPSRRERDPLHWL